MESLMNCFINVIGLFPIIIQIIHISFQLKYGIKHRSFSEIDNVSNYSDSFCFVENCWFIQIVTDITQKSTQKDKKKGKEPVKDEVVEVEAVGSDVSKNNYEVGSSSNSKGSVEEVNVVKPHEGGSGGCGVRKAYIAGVR